MYKALLVDPCLHTLAETKKILQQSHSGFQIHSCVNGEDVVIEHLNQQTYSLVIINMKSYNASGIVLCSKIRQHSRIPIILIGGRNNFHLARKALTYQISDYLPEPLSLASLKSSLMTMKKELDQTISSSLTYHKLPVKKQSTSGATVIESVKKYVQAELHHNITLKHISRQLHFNCAYLGQKFKHHENMSFNEYLLQQRMEKAKLLLKKTDLKIYEIANEVGYSEIDWFYKKFKEYTGSSANEYRKKYELSRAN